MYLLIAALIVLIGVLSSNKMKKLVGRIYDYVLQSIPIIIAVMAIVLLIIALISFAKWGWAKWHEEIPGLLLIGGIVAFLGSITYFGNKLIALCKENTRLAKFVIIETFVLTSVVVLGIIIICLHMVYSTDYPTRLKMHLALLLFSYSLYAICRFYFFILHAKDILLLKKADS